MKQYADFYIDMEWWAVADLSATANAAYTYGDSNVILRSVSMPSVSPP